MSVSNQGTKLSGSSNSPIIYFSQTFFFAFSIILVITVYIWFISFGSWTNWPTRTTIYDQLAKAFKQGNLSIDRVPDSALLELENPYNPKMRAGYKYPQDVSLYEGKYYYYFGPIPALILMVLNDWITHTIADQYLAFAFITGIFILQTRFIIMIWKRLFLKIPVWIVYLCLLFVGLASPFTWALGQASVYIVASASGQFFFLLGLYLVIKALDQKYISAYCLFGGGVSWAFSLGSRLTQIFPIGFSVFMVFLYIIRECGQNKLYLKTIFFSACIGLPLVSGISLLGWYNWARFNSFFETGLYYQLAGPYLQKYYHILFSPHYLLPNIYDYVFMRPKISDAFPFLYARHGWGAIKFSYMDIPQIYHEGNLTGLIFTTPFILFASFPVILSLLGKETQLIMTHRDNPTFLYNWIVLSLFGSFIIGFAILALFFWALMRYLIDCIPSLLLLSVMGFWQVYLYLIPSLKVRRVYLVVSISLLVVSIIISNLLAFSSTASQFIKFDPGV